MILLLRDNFIHFDRFCLAKVAPEYEIEFLLLLKTNEIYCASNLRTFLILTNKIYISSKRDTARRV